MNNKPRKSDFDRKFKLVKDSGDVRKIEKGSCQTQIRKICDRGDPIARSGVEKVKPTENKLADVLPRTNYIDRLPSSQKENDVKLKSIKEIKKIRDNYTMRLRQSNIKRDCDFIDKTAVKVESELKNDRPNKQNEDVKRHVDRVILQTSPSSSDKTEPRRKISSKTTLSQQFIRKPIIKTITSRNDKGKVYKAVNFVERKVKPTQLQINIPTDVNKIKENTKQAISKASVRIKRKIEKNKKRIEPSATPPHVTVKIKSPPTEVAKWGYVDHTKVYYEAWVDTTLAAISKKVNQKTFDKSKLVEAFEMALAERPASPDFDYNMLLDEKYTGKIRVNKR